MATLPLHEVHDAIAKAGEAQRLVSATGKLTWSGDAAAQYSTQRPAAVLAISQLQQRLRDLEMAILTYNLLEATVVVAPGVSQQTCASQAVPLQLGLRPGA